MRFVATVDGAVEMVRSFNRIEQQISDFRFIWPAVAEEFYSLEAEQFKTEGASGASGRWASLSLAYAKYKAVHFPNMPLLKATTSLFDSMTSFEAPGAVYRPDKDELTIGTSVPYAIYHQRGTKRMPARPIISLSDSGKRRIQKAIQIGLVQFIRRQGFNVLENAA